MTRHSLAPSRESTVDVFDRAAPPALTVDPGDTVVVWRAAAEALGAMVTWLQGLSGLGRAEALALASPVVDLRVTQVANTTWGVHALLPHGAVGGLRAPVV